MPGLGTTMNENSGEAAIFKSVFMPGLGTTMNENSGEAAIFKSEIGD
jgi:hypothetical protein